MPRYSFQWTMTVTVKAKHAIDHFDAENIAIEQRKAALAAIKPDTRTVAHAGQVEDYQP
jgi:hypothetical protein